ncbi:MAG: alpha/beta fold hydrolase [Burkholderiaceae bacterium]
MATHSDEIRIPVGGETVAGTIMTPGSNIPGVLFVHGWGGAQSYDLSRARMIAGLGCVCLTFDLRGHGATLEERQRVTREDNLLDLVSAYDRLIRHPAIDHDAIAVVACSYGAYLAALLTTMRPVRWLALQSPALYRDTHWSMPKFEFDPKDLATYRRTMISPEHNRALGACERFTGDVLLVEAEHDEIVPHETIMSYRAAFLRSHSLTHRIIDGADHGLSSKQSQQAYAAILTRWATEMIVGARTERSAPIG